MEELYPIIIFKKNQLYT